MKITFDVDCTPEEARSFFGLPDVKPMQDALLAKIEERMAANLDAISPEALLRTWLPAGVQGIEQLQKMFWTGLQSAQSRDKPEKK
ncbi:DUF6489 family protein [Telmatospirillum siberiense]|uniref:Ribosomal protein S1 n=1 Tax=Telmatospirillum siberiense TaxID=382514 RepID=A0A2N3PN09_9PROT|nr:DUF6489 family protein [Telmatospirillum siberiense]PKU21773.1 hypothetical protein CWS72_25000 [Telmatospirillum siberiense]